MYLISSREQPTRDRNLAWRLGGKLRTPRFKKLGCYETLQRVSNGFVGLMF
jgi:hypothetical protein